MKQTVDKIRAWKEKLQAAQDCLKDKPKTSDVYFPLKEVIAEMEKTIPN